MYRLDYFANDRNSDAKWVGEDQLGNRVVEMLDKIWKVRE